LSHRGLSLQPLGADHDPDEGGGLPWRVTEWRTAKSVGGLHFVAIVRDRLDAACHGPARGRYDPQKSHSHLARFVQAFRPTIQVGSYTMKRLKILGFALVAALGASQAGAEELTGTLKNIKETGAITLGFRDSSIPFSYLDDNQKPVGFAMDICYKIV